jgi:formate dehydrogenase (coenzyme F420) beta subunit
MKTAKIDVSDHDLLAALRDLARRVLAQEQIDAILVPRRLPMKAMVMPALVSDPEGLEGMDPLAPAYALNAARMVSRLTRKPSGGRLAVMLRPCEIRAFIELVKLNQGSLEDVLIIGTDCLGACQNKEYLRFAEAGGTESTRAFYEAALAPNGAAPAGLTLAPACQACEAPLPEGADLAVLLFGVPVDRQIVIQAQSEKGIEMLDRLALAPGEVPEQRAGRVAKLIENHILYRDDMFLKTRTAVESPAKLSAYLAACVNCYNCRVACPVCYCRECVFVTDVFDHEPAQYLAWARRKGTLKMPTDTLFYHLTRLAHMSTACVGCGQCSNACPNDIPVMELFRTVAQRTQAVFDYRAGADVTQKPPLTEFREKEFEEAVGIACKAAG